ncbi:MAG: PAS domain-containing protein [Alphaproteobacteria bacterium]|nr:PAS domain-containing protein [Alphaproteobacteria bacterium]
MRLNSKISLILLATVVASLLANAAVMWQGVLPRFDQLDRRAAFTNASRADEALKAEMRYLSSQVKDWAFWTDTHEFMQGNAPDYVESNLFDETLLQLDVNVLYFIKPDGEVVWSRALASEDDEIVDLELAELPADRFALDHPLIQHQETISVLSGIFKTAEYPVVFASSTILNNEKEGPVAGTLIMGRIVDANRLELLQNQTSVEFEILPHDPSDVDPSVLGQLAGSNGTVSVVTEMPADTETAQSIFRTEIYQSLTDAVGAPAYVLFTPTERVIHAAGVETVLAVIGMLGLAGIVVLGIMWTALRKVAIKPLEQFTRAIQSIGQTGRLSARTDLDRGDEIGILSRQFDELLDDIEHVHDQLEQRVAERTVKLRDANESLRREIAERKNAEQSLAETADQLRLVTDNLPVAITYVDADRSYRFVNRTTSEWLARPAEEILGRTVHEVMEHEYEKLRPYTDRVLAGEQIQSVQEIAYPDGITRIVQLIYVPRTGSRGNVEGYYTLIEDITELKQAEQALHHAQRMEAVGQLTGGIAHDFNNMLAAVIGNLQMLGDQLKDNAKAKRPLDIAFRAASRAADLTHRLLAFSRQQHLEPEFIELPEMLADMDGLLQSSLTERIELVVRVADDLSPIWADPAQLENAILNLAINARDAMPEGGRLIIDAANVDVDEAYAARHPDVRPSSYVALSVTDNGVGIAPEIQKQVFDPFFTTKDVGQGTGLGLSTIYGLMKQLGGHLSLYSEEGHGTCVTLYLPVTDTSVTVTPAISADATANPGGAETVLVVEDDADVRETAMVLLEDLGYRVLAAADGPAALALLQENGEVDLLFTDIVMPNGLSGFELAREAASHVPDIKVLCTSGYSEKMHFPGAHSDQEIEWIGKPYLRDALAQKVRQVLDKSAA